MSKRYYLLFILISSIFFIFIFLKNINIEDEVKSEYKNYVETVKTAKKIVDLKKRYENNSNLKKVLLILKKIKTPEYEKDKKEYIELYFKDLNPKLLNKIVKKIINSNLLVKFLEIKKNSNNRCELKVSFKK